MENAELGRVRVVVKSQPLTYSLIFRYYLKRGEYINTYVIMFGRLYGWLRGYLRNMKTPTH